MNNFNKVSCQILRDEINKALAAVGAKHNVKFAAGAARFTDKTISFKLDIAAIDASGVAVDKDMETLKRYKSHLGLSDSDMTKTFVIMGKKYKLSGYIPRKYARPFVLIDLSRNCKVMCSRDMVESALHGVNDLGSIR